MKETLIYKDYARYYDLLYSFKDYKKEAGVISRLIRKFKKSEGCDLLEAGCGTGKHLQYLKKDFKIVGTDLNAGILAVARKNNKGVVFKQADMVKLNLKKQFDVVVCLFSAIGYVKTYANLKRTIEGFARHLKPGGVVIIEPWYTKATYKAGSPHITTYEDADLKIARLNVSMVRGDVSVLDMHHLVAERNKPVLHFIDHHELGMFEPEKFLQYMKAAGLNAQFMKNGLLKGRGLYIGVKK